MKTIADSCKEEGFENVAITKALEITRRMLQEKVDINLIASVTGFSTDEILKIQYKL